MGRQNPQNQRRRVGGPTRAPTVFPPAPYAFRFPMFQAGILGNYSEPFKVQVQNFFGPPMPAEFPYAQVHRTLPEVCKRYPKLHLSPDFLGESCHWSEWSSPIPLNAHLDSIVVETDKTLTGPPTRTTSGGPRHVARVLILNPMQWVEPKPTEPDSSDEGQRRKQRQVQPPHPFQQLRFIIAVGSNGGYVPYGGEWEEQDGPHPEVDATLRQTAIRHTKNLCGLDLSVCTTWLKFAEFRYRRPNGICDRTVIFIPDVWNHFVGLETKIELCKTIQREEAELESQPRRAERILFRPREVTLHVLLEHDSRDKGEPAVETSLLAAAFDEMLSEQNGRRLLIVLRKKKRHLDEQQALLKSKREELAKERQLQLEKQREEQEVRRRKLEEGQKATEVAKSRREEEEQGMTAEQLAARNTAEAAEAAARREADEERDKTKKEEEERHRREELERRQKEQQERRQKQEDEDRARGYRIVVQNVASIDKDILQPFRFFDKPFGSVGHLRREILERALYSLGDVTRREMDSLLRAVNPSSHVVIPYKQLATYTIQEERHIPIEPAVVAS
eukprot:TRINITY_DN2856_c0_g1_i1.p1 TRINITY_DN2856_c0_g1~~TRINITY_DN2856_c0_g1_i1.p1  ORF type:complete len:561 (-),score=79.76 TRINITY_DN2856_c0_g1_i1:12-1694(-)